MKTYAAEVRIEKRGEKPGSVAGWEMPLATFKISKNDSSRSRQEPRLVNFATGADESFYATLIPETGYGVTEFVNLTIEGRHQWHQTTSATGQTPSGSDNCPHESTPMSYGCHLNPSEVSQGRMCIHIYILESKAQQGNNNDSCSSVKCR